ncbi:MAG: esterase [Lachnospiraceae bacterium]|nr:esterase [Lachnospiraceae bacterium]
MISTYGKADADTVLIQMADTHDLEEMESEVSEIKKLCSRDFCLTAVKIHNWNRDLSPWHASAVYGNEGFGDGAPDMLSKVLKICTDQEKNYIIGGYSLAGLFSLWAVYQTDVFKAAAAASPSLWFPGFIDYMRENRIHTGSVYLSLGDREEKTRNPVMASVGNRIREAHALLDDRGIDTTLEWNPGNHFRDTGIRMAKAFAWVLNRLP